MLMSAIRIVNKLDVNITLGLEPLGDEIRMDPEALFEIEYQPGFAPVPLVEIRTSRVSLWVLPHRVLSVTDETNKEVIWSLPVEE